MKNNLLNPRIILLAVSTIVIFSACKKNEDNNPTANIIGTWNTTNSSFSAKIGDKSMTQYFIDVMGASASDAQLSTNLFNLMLQQAFTGTITFKSDYTYTSTLGNQNDNGSWTISADGKKLTIDPSSGNAILLDIEQLTKSTLKVHSQESFSDDVNQDGTPETITADIDLTFTKQ
jgi:hypothetical protein